MANEITVTTEMRITKDNLTERYGVSYTADMDAGRGPTPGLLTATTTGVSVDLSQLVDPGHCFIKNLSEDYRIEIGMKDTSAGTFLPLIELKPGQGMVIPLARNIESELTGGAGTGTAGSGGVMFIKSITGSADVQVLAFQR